jgi:hypothetical protein
MVIVEMGHGSDAEIAVDDSQQPNYIPDNGRPRSSG